jgi:hypothetical protein
VVQARYGSLDSFDSHNDPCLAVNQQPDHHHPQQQQQHAMCPSAPLGMCYAPMVPQGRSRPGSGAPWRAPRSASPVAQQGAAAANASGRETTDSEGRLGLRQRACKRKIKYSDSGAPSSTTSGA